MLIGLDLSHCNPAIARRGAGGSPGSSWILDGGVWSDAGVWIDAAGWQDAA